MKFKLNPLTWEFNLVPDSGTLKQKLNWLTGKFNLTNEANKYKQIYNIIEGEFNLRPVITQIIVHWIWSVQLTNAVENWLLSLKVYWWIDQVIPPNTQWPCPDWYHIPSSEENIELVNAMTAIWIDTSDGISMKTYLKMPYAWYRNQTNGNVAGQWIGWRYWSNMRFNVNAASILAIGSNMNNPQSNANTAYGMSIRPFKDEPVIPTDSGWTTLYDDENWQPSERVQYVKRSSSLWLITIRWRVIWPSWMQNKYITIADKNLWATQVYNNGDTLSEDNCWKYYQWWNNYGFDWTWSVTTSSTQVDASWYWPWNRYSDSTFIAVSGDWSSTYNSNLWWGDPTPSPSRPANLICNNGILKIDWQWQIYADWITEIIEDELDNTATAEMLLAIWDTKDEQEILSWTIIRKCWICVYDWTQTIGNTYISNTWWLDNWAIVIYLLATPTTESVTWQTLNIPAWNSTIEITQASIDNLEL